MTWFAIYFNGKYLAKVKADSNLDAIEACWSGYGDEDPPVGEWRAVEVQA